MKTTKRIISLLLTLTMIVTSVYLTAFAEETATEETTTETETSTEETEVITVNGLDYLAEESNGVTANADNATVLKQDGVTFSDYKTLPSDAVNYIKYKVNVPRQGEYAIDFTYTLAGAAWIYIANETNGNLYSGNVLPKGTQVSTPADKKWTGNPVNDATSAWSSKNLGAGYISTDSTDPNTLKLFLKEGENVLKIITTNTDLSIFEMRLTPVYDVESVHVWGRNWYQRISDAGAVAEADANPWITYANMPDKYNIFYDININEPGVYEMHLNGGGLGAGAWCDIYNLTTSTGGIQPGSGVIANGGATSATLQTMIKSWKTTWKYNNSTSQPMQFTMRRGVNRINIDRSTRSSKMTIWGLRFIRVGDYVLTVAPQSYTEIGNTFQNAGNLSDGTKFIALEQNASAKYAISGTDGRYKVEAYTGGNPDGNVPAFSVTNDTTTKTISASVDVSDGTTIGIPRYTEIGELSIKDGESLTVTSTGTNTYFYGLRLTRIGEWFEEEIEEPDPEEPEEPEVPVEPGTAEAIVIKAQEVMSLEENVGYYSEGTFFQSGDGILISGATAWGRYIVDAPHSGEYYIDLTYKTNSAVWFELTNETTGFKSKGYLGKSSTKTEMTEENAFGINTSNVTTDVTGTNRVTIYLEKGINILKAHNGGSNLWLYEIKLTPKYPDQENIHLFGLVTEGKEASDITNVMSKHILDDEKTVTYDVYAAEPGTYSVSILGGGHAGPMWITGITNAANGSAVANGIIAEYSSPAGWISTLKDNSGNAFDMKIKLEKGLNKVTINRVDSSSSGQVYIWGLRFVKTAEYVKKIGPHSFNEDTSVNVTNPTGYSGSQPFVTLPSAENGNADYAFAGSDGKYKVEVYTGGRTDDKKVGFSIKNSSTDAIVLADVAPVENDSYSAFRWTELGELELKDGDVLVANATANATWFAGIRLTWVDENELVADEDGVNFNVADIHSESVTAKDEESVTLAEGGFVAFRAAFLPELYDFFFEIAGVTEDTLLRIATASGNVETYKYISPEFDGERLLPISFVGGEEVVIISVAQGSVVLSNIYAAPSYSNSVDFTAAFLEASTPDEVENVLMDYEIDLDLYVSDETDGIFYKESVYNTILKSGSASCASIASAYNKAVYKEKTNPSVVLENSELSAGDVTLTLNASDWLDAGVTVVLALYADNTLVDIDMTDYVASGSTLTVTVPETQGVVYTYKFMFWENGNLKPYSAKIATPNVVYVSSLNGDDTNNGSENAPVATLRRAKELANEKKNSVDTNVYVLLSEGIYDIESELLFLGADSGISEERKIIYSGSADGETVITGGKEITDWTTTDSALLTASYSKEGNIGQLEVNGEAAKTSVSPKLIPTGIYKDEDETYPCDGFVFNTADLHANILNEKSAELYWSEAWYERRFPIKEFIKISDTETAAVIEADTFRALSEATLLKMRTQAIEALTSNYRNGRFLIIDTLCYTDEPGEYHCDTVNNKVYYYPESGQTVDSIIAYEPASEGLLRLAGTYSNPVKNLVFENITFKNGAWDEPREKGMVGAQAEKYGASGARGGFIIRAQITFDWCKDIIFRNNTIKNVAATAIALNDGVVNCEILGNTIKNTSASAIRVGHYNHTGNSKKRCSNNTIYNNKITNVGLQHKSAPGISAYYTDSTTISHNDIENCTYSGIHLGWGWGEYVPNTGNHVISYNKIENIMTELNDGAHIYTLGPTEGSKIYGNYLKKTNENLYNGVDKGDRGGLYFDNGSAGIDVYDNVIVECKDWMFSISKDNGTIDRDNDDSTPAENCPINVYNNYSDTEKYVNIKSTQVSAEPAGNIESNEAKAIIDNAGLVN